MISFSGSLKIFLLVDCCDMRKGFQRALRVEEGLKGRFIPRESHAFNKMQFRIPVCMENRPKSKPARLPNPTAIGAIARAQWTTSQSDSASAHD
jgi:hypothetical protein